jgi:dipeptidyl aminopeptidase/acylaminoacyl peptidase
MLRARVALVLLCSSTCAVAAPPPLSLYGQLPNIASIELSPDGSKWAAVLGDEQSAQIQVRSTADNSLIAATPAPKSKVRDVGWVGNGHVMATIASTERSRATGRPVESQFLLTLDLARKGSKWEQQLRDIPNAWDQAAGPVRPVFRDGKPFLSVPVFNLRHDSFVLALAEVDLTRGKGYIKEVGSETTAGWSVAPDGRQLARTEYRVADGEWTLSLREGNDYRPIYREASLLDGPYLRGFGRDNATLILSSQKSGKREDFLVNLADGSISGPTRDFDADSLVIDRSSRTVIGTKDFGLDAVRYDFFNPQDATLWRALAKGFAGERVDLESWSDDRQTVIVSVEGEKSGIGLFLINRRQRTASPLALRYAGLGPEHVSPVTSFTYKAADGLEIPAYLALPRGREPKALPLIVLAHGGPEARDYPGFDWWAQALASRGYAVLQPQFRGSEGFGDDFRDAGYGQWGRKMQTDVSDGVRDLVVKGTVDAKRVCIVGASYGGYAAMAGVTVERAVYRCASAVAGVSDLRRMLLTEAKDMGGTRNPVVRYWQRFMGAKSKDDVSIDAWSPARLAAKVTVPLQLIHGRDDTVVRLEQSRLMRDAMQEAGKPVEYLELDGEDHFLSKPATRIAMLEAQVAFLLKHNPPD